MNYLKKIGLLVCLQLFVYQVYAQWPANINVVTTETNVKTTVEGNLEQGKTFELGWGHHSANNCFPESAKEYFRGKHVLYTTYLPPHSTVTIILRPTVDSVKMSLYAYMVGGNNFSSIVPNVHSCLICKSDYGVVGKTPKPKPNNKKTDKPQFVQAPKDNTSNVRKIELKAAAGTQAYNVMFGVSGVGETGTTGAYTIEVLVK